MVDLDCFIEEFTSTFSIYSTLYGFGPFREATKSTIKDNPTLIFGLNEAIYRSGHSYTRIRINFTRTTPLVGMNKIWDGYWMTCSLEQPNYPMGELKTEHFNIPNFTILMTEPVSKVWLKIDEDGRVNDDSVVMKNIVTSFLDEMKRKCEDAYN